MNRLFFVLAALCLALAAATAEQVKVADVKTEEGKAADLKTEEAIYYSPYTSAYYPTLGRADLAYPYNYAYSGYNYAYSPLAARSIYY